MATSYIGFSGSDEAYSLICLPCNRDDTSRPAYGFCVDCQEHLCHECLMHHRKAKLSRHHKIELEDTMPSTQQFTDVDAHVGTTDNLTTPCPHHKTEMIKLYCHDHKMILCSICVALEHTRPCHVDYIPQISDKMVNSQDYKYTLGRIDVLLKKCTTIKTGTSTDTKSSNDSLKDALQQLTKYRQEVNKRLDELEKEIESKLQELQQKNDELMKVVDTTCEDITKELSLTQSSIKQLNTSIQANQLFVEIKKAQSRLEDYERSINSLTAEDRIDKYQFNPNKAIHDVLQEETMLGDISTKHIITEFSLPVTSADDSVTPTFLGKIYVKSSKDDNRCGIVGMTMLPPDKLVLADYVNNSIKLVDVNSKSIISQLSLGTEDDDGPSGITSITSTQVAVTVPNRNSIQFISVRKPVLSVSDKLKHMHAIQTDGQCMGICCHQNKLIVTYVEPGKLEILDITGRLITRVTTDCTGTDIFTTPLFVQANSRSIYVSDNGTDILVMLNWNGEITGRITDMEEAGDLVPLADGSLLLRTAGDTMCQIAADRTNSRIVLQDMEGILAICVDEGGQTFYISSYTNTDKIDNNILVYKLFNTSMVHQ